MRSELVLGRCGRVSEWAYGWVRFRILQEKLFNVAGLPMVENCMAGYNSCMFAYGQVEQGSIRGA